MLPAGARRALRRIPGAAVESRLTLAGVYRVYHREGRSDVEVSQLVSSDGKHAVTLHGKVPALVQGERIAATGYRLGSQMLVLQSRVSAGTSSGSATTSGTSTVSAMASVGTVKVAVLVANFSDATSSPDMNAIKANFNGNPGHDAASYFTESSYGKMTLAPSFFGPYTLPMTTSYGCTLPNAKQALLSAAAADVTFSQFSRLIFVYNCPGTQFGEAISESPLSTPQGVITVDQIDLDTTSAATLYPVVHEISHTLGPFLLHAAFYVCLPDAFIAPTRFDTGCVSSEYGDSFDVLGGGPTRAVSQLDPFHKAQAGWFDPGQDPTISTPGTYTYTLAPYESPTSGVLALNIPRGQSGTAFTVEYRQPIGFDAWMGSPSACPHCTVTQGASIRLTANAGGAGGGSETQLIDTTPGTIPSNLYYPLEDSYDGALLPGRTFTDPEYGITITAVSADSSGLTVRVTLPAQTCVHAAPTATSPSPSTVTGSGTATVTLTNNDSAGCQANTFRFLPSSSTSTQLVASPDYLTLAPGASATVSLAPSAQPLTTSGNYATTGIFRSNTLGVADASVTVIYQVPGGTDSTAPSAPSGLSARALGSATVSLTWTASTDNVGVVGYRVLRNGSQIFTTDTNSLIDGSVSSLTPYSYTVQAFDRQGNFSPAATVSVTTPAKTDFTIPTAPTVTATASDHSLNVSWAPGTDNAGVAYYRVYPCFVPNCIVPAGRRSFTVTGLPTRTKYDLQLLAVDGDGNNSPLWSGLYTVYTAAAGTTAPSQPQHLISTSGSYSHVVLSWDPSTDDRGVAGYDIYRNNREIGHSTSTSFTDTVVGGSSEYYVQAVDTDGSLSAPSARVWFPPPLSPSSDSSPPTASITDPAAGATVSGTLSIASTASDDVGVTKVELYVDGAMKAVDLSAPYSFSLDTTTLSDGPHWLYVRAYDAAGNYGTAGVTNVTVANGTVDTTPPSVSIDAPSDGATVAGAVMISADASDPVGVADVSIAVDGSRVCSDDTEPYTCPWSATGDGDHTIEATAVDNAGNTASATVAVTVATPPDTTAPTVSFTSPAGGATVSGTTSVQASASDDTGVASVAFAIDGTTVATDTSGPWTLSVDTTKLANGAHTLTATASDAAGNSGTATEPFTVQNLYDTKAPSTPSNLKLAVAGTTQAAIYWTPSTDNVGVAGYRVYRDGVLLAQTTQPNYLDSGLVPGSSHTYTVTAFDAAGNVSASSSKLSVKAASLARSTTSTIAGAVFSAATGKPLANVVVTLTGMGLTKTAKTNTTGVYKFSSLPAGTYTITVSTSSTPVVALATQTEVVVSSS